MTKLRGDQLNLTDIAGATELTSAFLSDVVEDTTPQLGGDLDVNGNAIVSASAGDIAITPDTTGSIILDGLKWPQADGTADYVLKTDGTGQLSWVAQSAGSGGAFTEPATNNLVAGSGAGAAIAAGAVSNFIAGTGAGAAISTGDDNVTIGNMALPATTTTSDNIAIGRSAGLLLQSNDMIVIGAEAMNRATTGCDGTVAIGNFAGRALNGIQNFRNVAIGPQAMGVSTTSTGTSANNNIAIGEKALGNINGAGNNIAMGSFAGVNVLTGSSNLLLGDYSGYLITTGGGNICIGGNSGNEITTGTGNICIGTGTVVATTNNQLSIGNVNASGIPLIGGSFSGAGLVQIKGDLTVTGNGVTHLAFNIRTGTTYTLVLADDGKMVTMSNASSNTLTIPTNASVAFPVGTQILVEQEGAGQTTIAGPGVTLNSAGGLLSLASRYSTLTLIKKATNTWLIAGDLA